MSLTIPTTPRQDAALAAAAAADNVANRRDPPLTPEEFAAMRFGAEMDGWAQTLEVGLITVYQFVERFEREGVYQVIVDAAATDTNLAAFLAELRSKTDRVNLFSARVAAGLDYLEYAGHITAEQKARIAAVS